MKKEQYKILNDYDKALYLEETIAESMGYDNLGKALLYAMSTDEIIDYLEYIARCHEIRICEEVEEDD